MLAIRMQRTGRKGHAQFRLVVQDSHRSPLSGKVVAYLGHYNPHTKQITFKKEEVNFYIQHGAQPSDKVARLLKAEGIKMPKWVKLSTKKKRTTRNPDKLNKEGASAPVETKSDNETQKPADAPAPEQASDQANVSEPGEQKADTDTASDAQTPEAESAKDNKA
jgi:small subunit ribosomal protein S16